MYLNTFQDGRITSQLALRMSVPPFAVADLVRRTTLDAVEPVRVTKVTTLSDQMDASIVRGGSPPAWSRICPWKVAFRSPSQLPG